MDIPTFQSKAEAEGYLAKLRVSLLFCGLCSKWNQADYTEQATVIKQLIQDTKMAITEFDAGIYGTILSYFFRRELNKIRIPTSDPFIRKLELGL